MSLQNRLQDDLKKAMIERDKVRKNVIRFVRSVIHDREIERKQTLDDESVIDVLGKQAQQRRDSIVTNAEKALITKFYNFSKNTNF